MNREKQIEEMADKLCTTSYFCPTEDWDSCNQADSEYCDRCRKLAERLYNAGYRKQSENTVELPCNLNAEIWYIDKNYTIQKAEVSSINIKASSRHIIATRYVWETEETIKLALMFEHLNIDYWLTKEEAEEALAKMKGGAK
jgi:hypothetical protein